MTVKEGYVLRHVADARYVIAIGAAANNFHAVARVNTSGSIIFEGFKNGESAETIAKRLTDMFTVDYSRAKSNVDDYAQALVEAGIMQR